MDGMSALLGANVLNTTLRWAEGALYPWVAGTMGILYGLAFGLLLMSVRLRRS